jgi:hypothetical protein
MLLIAYIISHQHHPAYVEFTPQLMNKEAKGCYDYS